MMKIECPSCNQQAIGVLTLVKAPTTMHIKCPTCRSILKLGRHNILIAVVFFLVGIGLVSTQEILKLTATPFLVLFIATIMATDLLSCVAIVHFHIPLLIRKSTKNKQDQDNGTANKAL